MAGGWGGEQHAAAYAATCARLCAGAHDAVLEAIGPVAGRRVLDVGAGDGRLARRMSGAGAAVMAVDPDPAMVRSSGGVASGVVAGLPVLPFGEGCFDVVVAAFVVNHLADPGAGLAELVRVTAPGGRVVVTIWPSGATAQARMWADVLAAAEVEPLPGTRLPAHLDFPRTVEGLAGLLSAAGLGSVAAATVEWTHRGPVGELWDGAAAGIGGIGATVAAQPVEVRERLRAAYRVEIERLVVDGALCFTTEAVLGVGTVPGRMGG